QPARELADLQVVLGVSGPCDTLDGPFHAGGGKERHLVAVADHHDLAEGRIQHLGATGVLFDQGYLVAPIEQVLAQVVANLAAPHDDHVHAGLTPSAWHGSASLRRASGSAY